MPKQDCAQRSSMPSHASVTRNPKSIESKDYTQVLMILRQWSVLLGDTDSKKPHSIEADMKMTRNATSIARTYRRVLGTHHLPGGKNYTSHVHFSRHVFSSVTPLSRYESVWSFPPSPLTLLQSKASKDDRRDVSAGTTSSNMKAEGESDNQKPQDTQQKEGEDDRGSDNTDHDDEGLMFPWRHSTQSLSRLQQGTIENLADSHLLTTTSVSPEMPTLHTVTTAYFFLDVPWYHLIFLSYWKQDLADSMSFAFTQSVAALLSNLTNEPMKNIVKDTYEISFDKTISLDPNSADDVEDDAETTTDLESMMERKFVSRYTRFRETIRGKDIELCLKVLPVSAELYSLYCIPYISRHNIQTDPNLMEFYQKMLLKPSSERAPDLFELRQQHLENGVMESTVIAQIIVWCNEIFYVKDVATGNVLQGHEDTKGKNVPHLIRMEKVIRTEKKPDGSFRNVQGDWIISDLDDLMEGNLII